MDRTFTVEQNLSWAELSQVSYFLAVRVKILRRLFISLPCLGLLSGLLGLSTPGKTADLNLLTVLQWLEPMFIFLLFFLVVIPLTAGYVVIFKPETVRGVVYRFTSTGIERSSAKLDIKIPWTSFKELKETKSFFFLYLKENSINNTFVIQKRMFADAQQAEEFRRWVDGNLEL